MSFLTAMLIAGWQAPPSADAPPPVVNRRVPPPIPQPPSPTNGVPALKPPAADPTTPPPAVEQVAPIVEQAPPPQPTIQHVFLRRHDVNGDGRLSIGELERRFAKQFEFADLNGDGLLDATEILHDRRQIGKTARRLEKLDLDREGRLVFKGDKPPIPIADIARGVIDALDPNRDGFIEGREVGDAVNREVLPRVAARLNGGEISTPAEQVAPAPNALPTRTPNATPSDAPTTPRTNEPSPQPTAPPKGQGGLAPAATKDGLPSAEAMIANLDKDGDGKLDENETVDQLTKNFKTIDRNRDGKLDREELERALRLARMFGIKPMKPADSYKKDQAGKEQTPPK